MVLDTLKNSALYNALNPRLQKAFAHLAKLDLASLSEGRYEIDGDDLFFMIQERVLKTPEAASLEVHDKYIDIQIVVEGQETIGWKAREACTSPKGEMSVEKDIQHFNDKSTTYVTLSPGQFGIFFPSDGHAPLIGEGNVKKAVVKVLA